METKSCCKHGKSGGTAFQCGSVARTKGPVASTEGRLDIPDMGLHYPVYSRKCLRFQTPENGEIRDQSFEEEVLKTHKTKDRILHAAYTLQERNMQLLRKFK